jgi:Delta24(24(1))-sterol reductase
MVTTRSQSASPRKRGTPINYVELANATPSSPKNRSSPSKRAASTAASTTPSASARKPSTRQRRKSMADEIVVKMEREDDSEYVNGNGVERRSRSPRKVSRTASGEVPRTKSKPGHGVDKSGHFEFGGSFGTLGMMVIFPILMYYLWICSTFYGGSLVWKKESETFLAFLDRMVGHVTKVRSAVGRQLR